MNVNSLPEPAARSMYEEATGAYTALVRSRARAIYQVGNVRFPGLSDIDLLVVPERPAGDNQYFFSAFHRVPKRFLRLFLHEPFVVPPSALAVMRHTTHAKPKLLHGEDVLAAYRPDENDNERACRLLESFCSYERFTLRSRESGTLNGRWAMAIMSAFRFLLADFDAVFGAASAAVYGERIDALRADAFDRGVQAAVESAWDTFGEHFDVVASALAEELDCRLEPIAPVARDILRGIRPFRTLSPNYLAARHAAIEHYHDELERFGFPFGHLFAVAAYEGSLRTVLPAPQVKYVTRNFYLLQRRLRERRRG